MLLGFRRHVDLFAGENGCDPFRRPAALGRIVDHGKRLQATGSAALSDSAPPRSCQSPFMARAAARIEPAEVEGKDLGAGIPPELQRHQREQHGLACTRRTDHQRMSDVPDVEGEANGVDPSCPRKEQRRRTEMTSLGGPAQTADNGSYGRCSGSRPGGWRTLA
jgi:hypothetical protein